METHEHNGPNACPICGGPIPCLKHLYDSRVPDVLA